jgi:zinc transport system substrate-binding protein
MRNKKNLVVFVTVIALILASVYLLHNKEKSDRLVPPAQTGTQISVVVSFYPLAFFTQQIGGDVVDVHTLVSPGIEPHDFEPTPQDIVRIQKAKLLVYNGAGLETWVPRITVELPVDKIVNTSTDIELIQTSKQPTSYDPHVWLNPHLATQQVDAITAGLVKVDPDHKETYQKNATFLKTKLGNLDGQFHQGLEHCQLRTIVTSHDAFEYLAQEYHLNVTSIAGLSPDEEPTPQKLAEISKLVKAQLIKYIFFETLVSPKLAQTVAQETGAQTISFNPLEGLTTEEIAQGQDYFSVQEQNLKHLRQALDCK